jgi:toxin ParE1/3/4
VRRLVIAPAARLDAAAALRESRRSFGPIVRGRYGSLILAAYEDIRADPTRPGVQTVEIDGLELNLYHLRHSRLRPAAQDRISRPRHLAIFTFDLERVRVIRLLHDSMDVGRHISPNV